MKHFINKCLCGIFSVGMLSVGSPVSANEAEAEPPMIETSSGITEIERLKIDVDPTLMTCIKTDWEIPMASSEANENGHALLCHGGYVYTYLNRYRGSVNANPILRRYDANNPESSPEEKEPNFSDLEALWNGYSLLNHLVLLDDDGKFLFIFGRKGVNEGLVLVAYDFDADRILYDQVVPISGVYGERMNMQLSGISFSKGSLSGSVNGEFVAEFLLLGDDEKTNTTYTTLCTPVSVKSTGSNAITAENSDYAYNYKSCITDCYKSEVVKLGEEYILITHFTDAPDEGIGRVALFKHAGSGSFNHHENWDAGNSGLAVDPGQAGLCFGMNVIQHDGHRFVVYAKSYVGKVVYNVALWDDPSSFSNMKLLGRIKVPGELDTKIIYDKGVRQLAVQAGAGTVSRENDYNVNTVFYTYAPGASLARHTITTETDLIYTGIATAESDAGISLEGRVLTTDGKNSVLVYDADGRSVAAFPAETETHLDKLAPGFYIVKCGSETLKAVLR
ncbi:MAG: hypothetical protein NC210_05015 [[Clostridium] fimetarium]|nr:hypothetical protein [Alistipes timonensis]MCM1405767.1 hypothetical protein [[Clostridium] fimetarium]